MKHFYPDRSGLFQDDRLHESQRVTECFDGYKKLCESYALVSTITSYILMGGPIRSFRPYMGKCLLKEWCFFLKILHICLVTISINAREVF